ncbi:MULTISPECIES: DUF58 domain-containing protein [Haloferax]|uniref:DUF58 domain-containing protein n=2 Tax=Haloferax TaxID=2251 RepID=A0A6G1Z1D3_9EURY|nr:MULTISPECIES: DUF58 domain-containing protein [Haloferax]KAB1187546.1 DUF58 domain-containing protein [Haloferax sp. CBA1149]MRW80201.1 DUF58 domain-containing protein [Haloferax marinisediminis]
MVPTRRWALLAGTACFFAVFAVVLGEPVSLFAAGGLTAWLLVAQLDALRTMTTASETLSTTVSVDPSAVSVGDRAAVTVRASLSSPLDAPLDVAFVAPPSVDVSSDEHRRVTLEPGETAGSATCSVSFPIAGRIAFESIRVTLHDRMGYFTETVTIETDAACLVESPAPNGIHVGQGGERSGAIFGEHSSDQTGPGLVTRDTRQYLPGDTLSQIDWKTTARMNHPHIREFESESDYLLSLVVDVGSHMNRGPDGRTMFAYGREVALGLVQAAEAYNDPLSTRLVADEGTVWEFGPSSSSNAYQTVRRKLLAYTPATGTARMAESSTPIAPTDALARGAALEGDDSAFARTLRPYLTESTSYVSRVVDKPLFDAVKTACSRVDRDDHLVLVTDDSSKAETYEAVVVAAQRSSRTTVFLTPNVLFDEGPADRNGFIEFEEFRKRLDRLPTVTAYEVGPKTAVESATASVATSAE